MKILKLLFLASLITYSSADLVRVSDNIIKDTKSNFLWQDSKEVKTEKKETIKKQMNIAKILNLMVIRIGKFQHF